MTNRCNQIFMLRDRLLTEICGWKYNYTAQTSYQDSMITKKILRNFRMQNTDRFHIYF